MVAKRTAEANAPIANYLSEIGDFPTNAMNVLSDLYSLASLRGEDDALSESLTDPSRGLNVNFC